MDIGTILGVLAGLGLILTAIMMGSGLQVFIDYPSMMVVGGGTIAALFIAYPMKSVFLIIKVTKKAIFHKPMEIHTIIADASRFSPLAKTPPKCYRASVARVGEGVKCGSAAFISRRHLILTPWLADINS